MKFRGEYYFLSNMYPVEIAIRHLTFTCVESAFQALKCVNPNDMKQFEGLDGYEAKKLGRKVNLRPQWDSIKDKIMLLLLREKFKHPELRQMLINTGDIELIEENTWGDTYWGACVSIDENGNQVLKGKNTLGKLLMKVREDINKQNGGKNNE